MIALLLLAPTAFPVPVTPQEPSWLAAKLEGRALLFVDPTDPGVVVAHVARTGATKRVSVHLTEAAAPYFDRAKLQGEGSALVGAVLPDPAGEGASPYVAELDVYVDASLDGKLVQVTSLLRVHAERAVSLDDRRPGAYAHAEVYEAPLVQNAGTAYLGDDPAGDLVRGAMRASANHWARALEAASSGPADPLPPQGVPREASARSEVALVDREGLIERMRERGVILAVEEPTDQPELLPWLRRSGMGAEAATIALRKWFTRAEIPVHEVEAMPMDRPLPYSVSCQLQINTVGLAQTPLGQGSMVAVTGEITVYELFALGPDGETVVSNVGAWNGGVHQSHGRMSGYDANATLGHAATVLTSSVRDLLGGVLPAEAFDTGAATTEPQEQPTRTRRSRR